MSIEEAREVLRLDNKHNDDIIQPLLLAIPEYMEVKTGSKWAEDNPEGVDELAKVAAKFILQLWYYPQTEDITRINRTIDSLLYALTAKNNARQ